MRSEEQGILDLRTFVRYALGMSAPPQPDRLARVSLEQSKGITTLRLDRPEARNALDLQTWTELSDALAICGSDQSLRVIVLTGGGTSFSAGGDLSSMPSPGPRLTTPVERLSVAHQVVLQLADMEVPVVAAVERYAVGAAWGLALACDLVVAGEQAFFQAPFARRGLVADTGTGWHLARRIGYQRAMRYLWLAERMTAQTAYELGLVSHLAPDGEVTAEALRIAAVLAGGPGESNALTKSLARRSASLGLRDYLEAERIAFALAAHGNDAQEGLSAFIERREPSFR